MSRARSNATAARRPRRHPSARLARRMAEMLESRRLLTSTLYLDYGDRWAGGVLNTTVGAIDNTTAPGNPNVDGPRLTDAAGNNYADATTVAISSLVTMNPGNAANAAAVRAAMTALTRRFFEPFDITVVDLTAAFQTVNGLSVRAPANLTEASQLLGQNEAAGENNDTYLLIGSYLINGTDNPNSNAFGTNAYGGMSNPADINGDNDEDGTALVIMNGTGLATFDGPQNVHEAGHAFGLEHVYRQGGTAFSAAYDLLHQSEIMSYLGYNSQGGFNVFSRFPVMDGDGNTNANDLANDPTPYGDLVDDPNIGPSGIEYVTGTGAHDIITITKTGATTASVSLQAFSDAARTTAIDFPGPTGTTYTYTINTDRPLTIDAGGSNDQIVLDGDLGTTITLRGMHGSDELVVDGKAAATATYTTGTNAAAGLDGNSDFRGSLAIGSTVINFQEFEDDAVSEVTLSNVGALTYRTGGSDDALTLEDAPTAGRWRLDGSSDAVALVALDLFGVGALTIDTGTNDAAIGSDSLTIGASPLAGLNALSVNTGADDDVLTLNFNFGNAIPGVGGLSFDAGSGAGDLLQLRGGTFGTVTYTPSGPSSGNVDLDGSDINYANLAPINDVTTATTLVFNGTAGADAINVADGPTVFGDDTTQISSGNGTFELVNFANKTDVRVQGQNGADAFTLSEAAGDFATLTLYGEDALNALDDNAADAFTFAALPAGVPTRAFGGGGGDTFNTVAMAAAAGSTLALDGQGGDDAFALVPSAVAPVTVTGGAGTDVMNFGGAGADFDLANASITSASFQPTAYGTLERIVLTNGTFEVVGAVATAVHVNAGATLYGSGAAGGGVTVNAGGTVSPGVLTPTPAPGVLGTGNLAFTGGTYAVQLNGMGAGQHDELNVVGTVNLGAGVATLAATLAFSTLPGDAIVILRNDGTDAVSGFFAGAAQGAVVTVGGAKFTIDYAYDAEGTGVAFNDVALVRYGAQLGVDPCDPAKQALYVSATAGADVIDVVGANGSSNVRVLINGVDEGTFRPGNGSPVIVFGQNGNDRISSDGIPSRNVMLYGQAGSDTVTAGNGNSLLVGGHGDDLLTAANGKDIAIGGVGRDTADGGNGTDLLIADATGLDANTPGNLTALCEALEEWSKNGGANVNALIASAQATGPDASADRLIGGNAKDTFVASLLGPGVHDELFDRANNETLIEI